MKAAIADATPDALKATCSSLSADEKAKLLVALTDTASGVKPTLNYFSICGRGELARLICAAGELEFEDKAWAPAFDDSGGWRQGYQAIGNKHGFPGTMPILEHGSYTLCQTTAIESYLASIAPKFKALTPEQKGKDLMFQVFKADINVPTENLLFKKITAEDLKPIVEKMYGTLEGLMPTSGFINGLEFPTAADLAILVISKGCMPFQAAPTMADCSFLKNASKYPKMDRIAKAAAAYPPVVKYLAASEHKTLKADPFGIMPAEFKDDLA